jgi:hypothetical protein
MDYEENNPRRKISGTTKKQQKVQKMTQSTITVPSVNSNTSMKTCGIRQTMKNTIMEKSAGFSSNLLAQTYLFSSSTKASVSER